VARKADYVLAVKGNQESLHKAVLAAFAQFDADPTTIPHFTAEATEEGHGRKECRRTTTLDATKHLPPEILFLWPKLETLARIQSETQRAGKTVQEERFYISTLLMDKVETIANSVRSHWGIENELHWVLDVAFREDGLRTRMGNGPETGAILRHITLNMLRQDPNTKRSIRHRRLKAALSQEYRLAALLGFPGETPNA
jgi:predicted transposase YbfD/YdcC